MAEELRIQDVGCELQSFERNRYFYGKLLATRDFELEQRYMIGKDRLINSHVHGAGIVCGLELTHPDVNDGVLFVNLSAGLGLDCCGHEIIVSNATTNLRVRGNPQEGTNFIYLHYTECVKEPVPALANASTCEEVCCYNRIQESYDVRVSSDPPVVTDATFTGIVSQVRLDNSTAPLPGARVDAIKDGIVRASTLTDETGAYTLAVIADTYVIRASATGFQTASTAGTSVASGQTISLPVFALTLDTDEPDATTRCHEMTQQYYEERLRVCPPCDDPKVLLAVVNISPQGQAVLDVAATRQYREIVYSNAMLHDLMCDHVADFHNPHHTTAADVNALQSVNNVGNAPGQPHVSNINLVSSNSTVQITPQPGSQQINITTSPANNVTSVGPTPVVGNSLNFARENHVHDLSEQVVQRLHLNDEVINNLLTSSDGTVTVTPDTDNKTIDLQVDVGIRQLNSQGPDANGNFLLTNGDNITIQAGTNPNELIISTTGGGADFNVPSGRVIFERMSGLNEIRQSPPIPHELATKHVAIVMALEFGTEAGQAGFRLMGDTAHLPPEPQSPLLWAAHSDNNSETFTIILQDRRPFGQTENPPPPINFVVRWWAIPKTVDREDVIAPAVDDDRTIVTPDDLVVAHVAMRQSILIGNLAEDLNEDREALERRLRAMADEGRLTIDGNRVSIR